MNILFLTSNYYPDLGAGSFRSKALIDALLKKIGPNDKIEVITTTPNRYKKYSVDNINFEQRNNLIIHRINVPNYFNNNLRIIVNFLYYFYKATTITRNKKIDIVFATSSKLMTGVLGATISKRLKAKYYLDIRDIFLSGISDVYPGFISYFLYPLLSYLEKFMIRNADKINLISEGFIPYFREKYPKKTYNYFTNGIDDEFIGLQNVKFNNNRNRELEILYAGNIGDGQGLSKIIPDLAIKLNNKAKFKIIGDGGDLIKLNKNLKNVVNVQTINTMNRNELIKHYKNTDILFLHLNKFETFQSVLPSKIFEYAAIGKPIMAGIFGYSKIFLENNINNSYIFEPCNVLDAIEKFKTIKLNLCDRSDFISTYSRNLICENMSNEIVSLYEKNK